MHQNKNSIQVSDETIIHKIYLIRGQKIMLDRDLAKLYDVETKSLKQSIKRNSLRFPSDFMFEMSDQEFINWRSQFVTSNSDKMGLRYKPFCFTEQGVAMLSCVLHSEYAIKMSIRIIRVFTRIRQMMLDNTELRLSLEELRKKTENNTKNIELVFQYFDESIEKKENPNPRKKIGYKIPKK